MKKWALALVGLAAVVGAAIIVGPDVLARFADPEWVRHAIASMGPWAPLGLIALSAVQIVLAPIPGYLVQIAGGYLLGAWAGSVYGVIGMLVGAAIAFLLTRHFGAPLLHRLVPERLLEGWLRLRSLNSFGGWVIVLLLPVGDFCYFLAGLTALSLPRMLLATLLVRGPTVVVASVVGAQATFLPAQWLWLLIGLVAVVTGLVLWQRERLEILVFDRILLRILSKRDEEHDTPNNTDKQSRHGNH